MSPASYGLWITGLTPHQITIIPNARQIHDPDQVTLSEQGPALGGPPETCRRFGLQAARRKKVRQHVHSSEFHRASTVTRFIPFTKSVTFDGAGGEAFESTIQPSIRRPASEIVNPSKLLFIPVSPAKLFALGTRKEIEFSTTRSPLT